MKEYRMNDSEAKTLIKKLTDDTLNGTLKWEEVEIDSNIHIKPEFEIPLTTAKANYHYTVNFYETASAHMQFYGGLYYVWFTDGDEIAKFSDELFRGPQLIDMLITLGTTIHDQVEGIAPSNLKKYIEAYLGVN